MGSGVRHLIPAGNLMSLLSERVLICQEVVGWTSRSASLSASLAASFSAWLSITTSNSLTRLLGTYPEAAVILLQPAFHLTVQTVQQQEVVTT